MDKHQKSLLDQWLGSQPSGSLGVAIDNQFRPWLESLRSDRDELLAACKAAIITMDTLGVQHMVAYDQIQDAIDKAEGRPIP